jgi:type III pantothenate kinase
MLAIDIGNTNITAGIFEGSDLKDVFRVPTEECLKGSAFLAHVPDLYNALPDSAVMVSVRSAAAKIIIKEFEESTGASPILVDMNTPMGIAVSYETKETLGMDRLVCAAAAFHLYREKNRPLIVIDMGTATTIDYVSEDGVFFGGMIAPGIKSAYEGLISAAPQLPRLHDLFADELIGTSTEACVRSGVVIGHACMIRKVVEMMARQNKVKPVVVLTGGTSGMVAKGLKRTYIIDNNLILKGLSVLWSLLNSKKC